MSLLLEALKKAEKAKEDAQRQSGRPAAGDAGLQLEMEPAAEAKHVFTKDELPSIASGIDITSEDLGSTPAPAPAAAPAKDEADIEQIREELGINGFTAPSIEHLLAERRPFLGGDRPSIADCTLAAALLHGPALAGLGVVAGFDTVYRLERLSGRYAEIANERSAPRTVHALAHDEGIDFWSLVKRYHAWMPFADALYGSAVFVPMADGARYDFEFDFMPGEALQAFVVEVGSLPADQRARIRRVLMP